MKISIPLLFLLSLGLLCVSCNKKAAHPTPENTLEKTPELPILLSLENVHNQEGEEYLSALGDPEVIYVPLETTNRSLISSVYRGTILKNGNIVLGDNNSVQLFSPTGKHLRSVSKSGNGPADYTRIYSLVAHPVTGGFFLLTNMKVLEFDADGEYVNNFAIEDRLMDMAYEPDGTLLLHRMNVPKAPQDTVPTWFLYRYATDGTELKRFEDITPRMSGEGVIPVVTPIRPHYVYQGKTHINELGNDTLFIVEQDSLRPSVIFQLGKMAMDTSPKGTGEMIDAAMAEMRKHLFLSMLQEDDHFLYMTFGWGFGGETLNALYNKKNGKITSLGNGEFFSTEKGLTNDVDGGPPFFPFAITPDGVRFSAWQATSFKEKVLESDYKILKNKYGDRFEKVYQLAQSLKEDDNPVLIIVK